jgi:tetratricopeptide (TPR) repeat protein
VTANKLGAVLLAAGEHAQALDVLNRSLEVAQMLSALDPDNRLWRSDVAFTAGVVGDTLIALGRSDEALQAYHQGLAINEELAGGGSGWSLASDDTPDPHAQRHVSISHERIGRALARQKKYDAALDAFKHSLAIRSRLAEAAPEDANAHRDLYFIQINIGEAERDRGQPLPALAALRAAVEAIERVLTASPDNFDDRERLGTAIGLSHAIYASLNQLSESVSLLRRWLAEVERALTAEPTSVYWTKQHAVILAMLASAGDSPRERYQQALEIARRLKSQGHLGEGEADWVEKLEAAIAALPA